MNAITIEGIPVDIVARRKERIEEIDAQLIELRRERSTLVRICREIDGDCIAAAVSAALDEGLEHLPENDPRAENETRGRKAG